MSVAEKLAANCDSRFFQLHVLAVDVAYCTLKQKLVD